MSEMVERVARAICAAKGDDPDEKCEDWMREFSGWRGYQKSARAAIEAMREPTKEMIVAADAKLEDCIDSDLDSGGDGEGRNYCETVRSDTPSILFKAMIDEALR